MDCNLAQIGEIFLTICEAGLIVSEGEMIEEEEYKIIKIACL